LKKLVFVILFNFICDQLLFAQKHIHWGSTGDPLNGLVVSWQSAETSDQIKWGYTDSYEQGTYSGELRNNYEGYLYDYEFPTVNPSSTIHYSIFTNGVWTSNKTFQTSVSQNSTSFSFIAGGDSRTYMDDWQLSANKLATESVDFHLFMGDHVNSGSSTSDWTNWFDYGKNFLGTNLIYHTGGNHEYSPIYLNQFVMPENERWYSFEFGNTLFICLLSEEDFISQYIWLLNELATTTKKWKIVFFHKPFFTTGSHANDMNSYRNTWWKAFDNYGVDVILGGHTHYYLRTKPINLNISTTSAVDKYGSNPGEGRLQIVAGSYGAPVKETGSEWFIEQNLSTMNYTKFEINDSLLNMNAYNMSGTLIDKVTITKGKATDAEDVIVSKPLPTEFSLSQNFPNPFSYSTTINYSLSKSVYVSLKIYNYLGQEIETLVDEYQFIGDHQINWIPEVLTNGIYFYKLETGTSSTSSGQSFSETKILILQK
jgi:hypothetical protein